MSGLVSISRAELALRDATFARLHPETHAFKVRDFSDGVREGLEYLTTLDKDPNQHKSFIRRAAKRGIPVGQNTVHILPVHRNFVKHGWVADTLVRQGNFNTVAIPSGPSTLHKAILGSRAIHAHCNRKFQSLSDFMLSEKEMLEECVEDKNLIEILDRRLLMRVRDGNPMWSMGLRRRVAWDFMLERVLYYPFFKAAWAKNGVTWCGVPPELFEMRARDKTLVAEWERVCALEDGLADREATGGQGTLSDWFIEIAAARRAVLTPQEIVSDLNMRHVISVLKTSGKNKKILLVVPAAEYHLALGWATAHESLTLTSFTESQDPLLDIVPSFQKARKTPEFHSVERSIHVDTPQSAIPDEEKALTQDRRLAAAYGGYNPHISKTLRPSAGVKVFEVGRGTRHDGYVTMGQLTKEAREGFGQTPEDVI
eukprot:TRINITY_DN4550_c0_g1_i1.p1 TRINITY_DN4550_c0_g1~~TRINITY_DN4550_c0_g1_i1.p1  ORF type:complete len:427 (+),score=95.41 TRINITY_DN4550_c0_g1_i1:681-1961(+)